MSRTPSGAVTRFGRSWRESRRKAPFHPTTRSPRCLIGGSCSTTPRSHPSRGTHRGHSTKPASSWHHRHHGSVGGDFHPVLALLGIQHQIEAPRSALYELSHHDVLARALEEIKLSVRRCLHQDIHLHTMQ